MINYLLKIILLIHISGCAIITDMKHRSNNDTMFDQLKNKRLIIRAFSIVDHPKDDELILAGEAGFIKSVQSMFPNQLIDFTHWHTGIMYLNDKAPLVDGVFKGVNGNTIFVNDSISLEQTRKTDYVLELMSKKIHDKSFGDYFLGLGKILLHYCTLGIIPMREKINFDINARLIDLRNKTVREGRLSNDATIWHSVFGFISKDSKPVDGWAYSEDFFTNSIKKTLSMLKPVHGKYEGNLKSQKTMNFFKSNRDRIRKCYSIDENSRKYKKRFSILRFSVSKEEKINLLSTINGENNLFSSESRDCFVNLIKEIGLKNKSRKHDEIYVQPFLPEEGMN